VTDQERTVAGAERARRLDEVALAQRQHLGANDAREVGPVDESEDQHHHPQAAAAHDRAERDR
jgi:hypothetical protein